jgi:hypothetical protein
VFRLELPRKNVRVIRSYVDCTGSSGIVVHQWHRRETDPDRCVDDWEMLDRLGHVLRETAGQRRRRLVGTMQFEYLSDASTLPADTWRLMRSIRWREEPRPWRWPQLVLVRAWQQALPAWR